MKVVACELHHVAEDAAGSIVRAMLLLTYEDGTGDYVDVKLPGAAEVSQDYRQGWNAAIEETGRTLAGRLLPALTTKAPTAAEGS